MPAHSGESELFTDFVENTEPDLRRALIARYGPERGREATAEALAYAWEHWDRIKEMKNPPGYLYRVGQSKGKLRRRGSRRPVFPPERVEYEPWSEPALPEALSRLSEMQRTAVLLVHGFGWTYEEVADRLGLARSSVQKHAERGITKLRKALEVQIDA